MNRPRMRPPWPVYQTLVGCLLLFIIWGTMRAWLHHEKPLQKIYFGAYMHAGLMPDLSGLNFLSRQRATVPQQAMICYSLGKREMPAAEWYPRLHPHVCALAMTRAQFSTWLRLNIYGGKTPVELILWPLLIGCGLAATLWVWAWTKDQARHVGFRQGRVHLKGPRLVLIREFKKGVKQTGLGLWLERRILWGKYKLKDQVVRVEHPKEAQGFIYMGDPGSGKTSAMMSLLDDCELRGYRVVCYDPHRQYIKRYFDAARGDVILGLDDRAAAWNPCDEIDWSSESTAAADWAALMESLYPGEPSLTNGNTFYFISTSRDIGQHCGMHYRPNAQELAELYSHADPLLDYVAKGTPLEETLQKNTSGTRASIIGTLTTNIVPMLRQVRTPDNDHLGWSAREWSRTGKGWIFLTSTQANRISSGPIQRLWIDLIARNILSFGDEYPKNLPPTAIILDEGYALGMLMSVKMMVAEGRKSGLMIAMGFQGKAQVKEWYGEYHEVLISAPWHKILLHIGDVEGQKVSAALVGQRKVERMREHRGPRGERSWTTEEVTEYVVEPSDFGSLENRHGYMRVKEMVLPIQVAIPPAREKRCEGWIPRKGAPPIKLRMPSVEELRAKEERERQTRAQEATVHLYKPTPRPTEPGGGNKNFRGRGSTGGYRKKRGPRDQEGELWSEA